MRRFAFGFHLRPEHWGHGLAGEAARRVLTHAFSTLAVSSLFAGHHPRNDPSRRLLGKLGFKFRTTRSTPRPVFATVVFAHREDFESVRPKRAC